MKIAIIAIGVPSAGKTTALKPIANRFGIQFINRDEIRQEWFGNLHLEIQKETTWEEWFGDDEVRKQKEDVRKEAEQRTKKALAENIPVVLDSTFTEQGKRVDAIATARAAGAERVVGIFFNVPADEVKRQNTNREYPVQASIIERMQTELSEHPPALSDGFDALYTSDELEKFITLELAGLPELD